MPNRKYKTEEYKRNPKNNTVEFWEDELNNSHPRGRDVTFWEAANEPNPYDDVYTNYNEYDFSGGDGTVANTFRPVPFQSNIYEQDIIPKVNTPYGKDNYVDDNTILNQLKQDNIPHMDWGKAGKYGLGALGLGGAMYGLYRLINYLRNRNKPAAPAVPASNVVQPPVSPARSNRFRNRNKFKRKI